MAFVYWRTIRFQDTDAAGVVYFANVLSICHEAYEASLATAGIDLNGFFRGLTVAVPIVHAEVDYFQPMICGLRYPIEVAPSALSADKFKIQYTIRQAETPEAQSPDDSPTPPPITQSLVSRATTIHLCIHPQTRSRQGLPAALQHWLAMGKESDG